MLRISFVAGFGLLTLVGLVLSDRLGAQQAEDPFGGKPTQQESAGGDATARSTEHSALSAEDRIDAALDGKLKTPLEYIDTPLLDIADQLAEDYGIPILFDKSALDEVAISPDTELTISVSNITLRSALELMLKEPSLQDLTYIIDKEILLITTKDAADATLQVKVYRVDDFEHFTHSKSESKSDANCFSPLQHVITNCIDFDAWQGNGTGEGAIHLMKPGLLVVSQTHSVHRKIEELLIDLRKVKAEIDGGGRENEGYGGYGIAPR